MMAHLVKIGIEFCGLVLDEFEPVADSSPVIQHWHAGNTLAPVIGDMAGKQRRPILYNKTLSTDAAQKKIKALRPDILLICCYPK